MGVVNFRQLNSSKAYKSKLGKSKKTLKTNNISGKNQTL